MQTNCTARAFYHETENFMTYAYMYTATSCTRHLIVQCRRRSYNENWNNIYSVSVVNFFVSVYLSFL